MSSSGSPHSCRNTVHGSGTVNSAWASTEPRSTKRSISSLTSARTSSSSGAISCGPRVGSITRRYLACSGGSTWSGMSGRSWPMSTATKSELKISGCLSAQRTSSYRLRIHTPLPNPSNSATGHLARSSS